GVVAIFSHQLWRGDTPTLYGFGDPTRDYVHVDDVARALRAAWQTAGTFNVSTSVETSVSRIFEVLQGVAGSESRAELAPLRPGELERSCLDATRARQELNWQAEVGLPEGLERTYHALVAQFVAEEG